MHPLALPSNLNLANLLNLLYGQTLIYVLQTFLNSGKLLFSSQKHISGVFSLILLISTFIDREIYCDGHINASNIEQNQVDFMELWIELKRERGLCQSYQRGSKLFHACCI